MTMIPSAVHGTAHRHRKFRVCVADPCRLRSRRPGRSRRAVVAGEDADRRTAMVLVATVLMSPYLHNYDLALLLCGALLVARRCARLTGAIDQARGRLRVAQDELARPQQFTDLRGRLWGREVKERVFGCAVPIATASRIWRATSAAAAGVPMRASARIASRATCPSWCCDSRPTTTSCPALRSPGS